MEFWKDKQFMAFITCILGIVVLLLGVAVILFGPEYSQARIQAIENVGMSTMVMGFIIFIIGAVVWV